MVRRPRKSSDSRRGRLEVLEGAATISEATLFTNGRSQAVRLAAAYRFAGDSVYVTRWRGAVIPAGEAARVGFVGGECRGVLR
jgi:hypothetical protein